MRPVSAGLNEHEANGSSQYCPRHHHHTTQQPQQPQQRQTPSPNKRHRLTPRPHNIQRPCLDFEKMQQVSLLFFRDGLQKGSRASGKNKGSFLNGFGFEKWSERFLSSRISLLYIPLVYYRPARAYSYYLKSNFWPSFLFQIKKRVVTSWRPQGAELSLFCWWFIKRTERRIFLERKSKQAKEHNS